MKLILYFIASYIDPYSVGGNQPNYMSNTVSFNHEPIESGTFQLPNGVDNDALLSIS